MREHRWLLDGRCAACAMRREWPGARDVCPLPTPIEKNAHRNAARDARRARAKAYRAAYYQQHRERELAQVRARRALIGPEAVREENARHKAAQRERERLAAQQEAAE